MECVLSCAVKVSRTRRCQSHDLVIMTSQAHMDALKRREKTKTKGSKKA